MPKTVDKTPRKPGGSEPPGGVLLPVNLREALEERFLAYALSTITSRALPDARDGLKPVHRRILYGMHVLKLDPTSAFRKCAKIVGDVMGSFHPHGDQAIYEALVRLAQDFSSRYPLVDGQGNFGNIDGDAPAAYRYTEARMTDVARLLLEGIEDDTVDFRANYSGEEQEPIVLPSALPNLLANGTQGIAVGMATSVPPHNVAELCDAAMFLIGNRRASADKLCEFVPGPDFPTGGIIVDPPSAMTEIYATGRGSVRLRARWSTQEGERGAWVAVVTEIPYGVQKAKLFEKIGELFEEKKLPLVADIRDESAEDIRIVVEPRAKTVDPDVLMESLFRATDLEVRVPVNMNVLVDGLVPRVVSLNEALGQWLDHRRDVLLRRSRHRLTAIQRRLELLAGMIVVYLNLDEIIRIIREDDEPKAALMTRFELSDLQANYILDTRLRSLRRLEEMALRRERDELASEQGEIEALVGDERAQWRVITSEIKDLKKAYGPATKLGRRRTTFGQAPAAAEADLAEALIEREPITVVVTQKGWIRALRGHVPELPVIQYKGDDAFASSFFAQTSDKLLVLASNGKVLTLDAAKLPGGRGFGEPIRLLADIEEGSDIVLVLPFQAGRKMLAATSDGRGFVVAQDDLVGTTRKGRAVLNPDDGVRATLLVPADGDHVATIGNNRKLLVFPLNQTPEMSRGKGVRLQRFKESALSDAKVFKLAEGLTWRDTSGRTWTVPKAELRDWIGNRGDAGRLPPKGFPKTNRFG